MATAEDTDMAEAATHGAALTDIAALMAADMHEAARPDTAADTRGLAAWAADAWAEASAARPVEGSAAPLRADSTAAADSMAAEAAPMGAAADAGNERS